jgi:hypothetical protein
LRDGLGYASILVSLNKKGVINKRNAMNIIQSWKESLRLLKPENLKPFVLVTAKAVLDMYKSINKPLSSQGNWFLLGVVAALVIITNVIKLFHLFWVEAFLLNSIRYAIVFVFALALRPSIGKKGWSYFYENIEKFWYILVVMILLGLCGAYIIPFFFVWYLFFLFAIFDTHGTAKELIGAARTSFVMLLYNFPICAVAYAVIGVINIVLYYFIAFVLGYFGGLTIAVFLCILFVPIEVALIANLYIKFIHGQPSLYFKQPE